jgi:hypothetical protein
MIAVNNLNEEMLRVPYGILRNLRKLSLLVLCIGLLFFGSDPSSAGTWKTEPAGSSVTSGDLSKLFGKGGPYEWIGGDAAAKYAGTRGLFGENAKTLIVRGYATAEKCFYIAGGVSESAPVNKVTVKAEGSWLANNSDRFGYVVGGVTRRSNAFGNEVSVSDCAISTVMGGFVNAPRDESRSNVNAAANKVLLAGKNTLYGGMICGGSTMSPTGVANDNAVTISGGFSGSDVQVAGGYGSAAYTNKVTINGGSFDAMERMSVIGGIAAGRSANGNAVTLTGDFFTPPSGEMLVQGGATAGRDANHNVVTLKGFVNVRGGPLRLFGGFSASGDSGDIVTGNRLVLENGAFKIDSASSFQTAEFVLPADAASMPAMLSASGGVTLGANGKNAKIVIRDGLSNLPDGAEVTLIDAKTLTVFAKPGKDGALPVYDSFNSETPSGFWIAKADGGRLTARRVKPAK